MLQAVCFGDSISAGWGVPPPLSWVSLLGKQLYERGLSVCLHNKGIPGDTSWGGLSRVEHDVLAYAPALVSVQFGLNDCTPDSFFADASPMVPMVAYAENMERMLKTLQRHVGKVLVLTSHPCRVEDLGYGSYEKDRRRYNTCLREIVQGLGLGLCDIESYWDAQGEAFIRKGLSYDGVHLSMEGNRFYAEQLEDMWYALLCQV